MTDLREAILTDRLQEFVDEHEARTRGVVEQQIRDQLAEAVEAIPTSISHHAVPGGYIRRQAVLEVIRGEA